MKLGGIRLDLLDLVDKVLLQHEGRRLGVGGQLAQHIRAREQGADAGCTAWKGAREVEHMGAETEARTERERERENKKKKT